MTDEETWKPNPVLGGEHIEARKLEVLIHLRAAVDVAFYHIEEQLSRDIADAKKKAGDQKGKMVAFVKKAEDMPALSVVRKYWDQDRDGVLHHLTETLMRNAE